MYWWMNKLIVIPPYSRILYSNKEEQTCNNMGETQKHYAKWKKSETKGYILYDSTSFGILKKDKS